MTDAMLIAIIVALVAFQIIWIATHWDFFRTGGELHRAIYHSEHAKRWRRWTGRGN